MRATIARVAAAAAAVLLLAATPAAASYKPAAAPVANGTGVSTTLAALAGCPTGDGPASWGKAKVCPDTGGTARVHLQDALTDGYCVQVKQWSSDLSRWVTAGPAACTTGQWITFNEGGASGQTCDNGHGKARLYRGDGAYFTIPNTYC